MEYLVQMIDGLKKQNAELLKKYTLVFSCEPHEETWEYLKTLDLPVKNIHIHHNMNQMGCVPNSFRATMLSYLKYKSDFDIFLEDDDVPADDFLELAEYYFKLPVKQKCVAYGFYGFDPDQEGEYNTLRRVNYFWGIGYATRRHQWDRFFRDHWLGWGHGGVNNQIQENKKLYVVHPVQTRIRNVGVQGAHCNEHVYNSRRLGDYEINKSYIKSDQFHYESNSYTDLESFKLPRPSN
jgi:hypothetical protein